MLFRTIFDQAWSGKRHVASPQIDRYGNQNFAAIGDDDPSRRPNCPACAARSQPDQPRHHPLIPTQARSFVEWSTLSAAPATTRSLPCPRRPGGSTTFAGSSPTSAPADFETSDGTMRVRSLHPGVTLEQAQEASAFELTVTGEVPEPAHRRTAPSVRSSTRTVSKRRVPLMDLDLATHYVAPR